MKIILLFLCLLINSYCIKVTFVPIKVNTSLPTTSSEDKYFDLMNIDYYSYSSNIFILFIDNGFGLDYDNIKYCLLNNDPKIYPYIIDSCSFKKITHSYSSYSSSGIKTYGYIGIEKITGFGYRFGLPDTAAAHGAKDCRYNYKCNCIS